MLYGAYAEAQSLLDELAALADEKDATLFWKATELSFEARSLQRPEKPRMRFGRSPRG